MEKKEELIKEKKKEEGMITRRYKNVTISQS